MLLNLSLLHKKYKLKIIGVAHFGAHLGQEVNQYRELGINNIHLFEPQKIIFEELVSNFKNENGLYFYNFGLGSENSTVNLNLAPSNGGLSASILKPEDHFKYYPKIEFTGIEKINICKYDELGIKNINFLNIDIQGYEMNALKGSVNVLKNEIEYIFIEISRKPLYKDSALVKDIDNFLSDFDFLRVATKWASSKVPWADSFYIKKSKLNTKQLFQARILIFFQKFSLFYSLIDPYRKTKKTWYKVKQKLKYLLN